MPLLVEVTFLGVNVLLNRYRGKTPIAGSNPVLSAISYSYKYFEVAICDLFFLTGGTFGVSPDFLFARTLRMIASIVLSGHPVR